MKDKKLHSKKFIKTFFQDRKQVGAVAPSWRFLVNKMCNQINFDEAKVIVEFGPGTGVFTLELLKRMHPETKLIVLELNEEFYQLLQEKIDDSRMILRNESAEKIGDLLKEYGFEKADAILSSLPLAVIPNEIRDAILDNSYKYLKPGGHYIQYQYSLNAKKLIQKTFDDVRIGFVPVNVPPAFVYTASKN